MLAIAIGFRATVLAGAACYFAAWVLLRSAIRSPSPAPAPLSPESLDAQRVEATGAE
jgi:predicted metal-binding membrane protein